MIDISFQEQVDYIIFNKISDVDVINELIQKISNTIKQDKFKGRELGALISKLSRYKKEYLVDIKRTQKESYRRKLITGVTDKTSYWQLVGDGWLKIGHRPGGRKLSFDKLLEEKTTTIFTILGENEDSSFIENNAKNKGIHWLWLPLANGDIPEKIILPKILYIFDILNKKLQNKERIYIHCSAGLHRTGMIVNAFLIYLGYSPENAFDLLFRLRPLTAQEVRKHRIEWGNNVMKRP